MRTFTLRQDLVRATVNGFLLPLGVEPRTALAPEKGYVLSYQAAEDDEPDSYTFEVAAPANLLPELVGRLFGLFAGDVYGIVEVGSRDAYRAMDVLISDEPLPLAAFLKVWKRFETLLLEDGFIAAGANADEPFLEVFVNHWKVVTVHAPLGMRETIEKILTDFGLHEVINIWPDLAEESEEPELRSIIAEPEDAPTVTEFDAFVRELCRQWSLALDIDVDRNLDDNGREMGFVLWQALAEVDCEQPTPRRVYASVWVTAESYRRAERLVMDAIDAEADLHFQDLFSLDRVAYDERPEELADLPPFREESAVHLIEVDGPAPADASASE